jgi:hypothetical protein
LKAKYDWHIWFVFIGTGVVLCGYITNYVNHTPQSNNNLVCMGPAITLTAIILIIMWKVPFLKPHASIVSTTLYGLVSAIFYNLANRDMLLYPVDSTNLDFFSSYLSISFIW